MSIKHFKYLFIFIFQTFIKDIQLLNKLKKYLFKILKIEYSSNDFFLTDIFLKLLEFNVQNKCIFDIYTTIRHKTHGRPFFYFKFLVNVSLRNKEFSLNHFLKTETS